MKSNIGLDVTRHYYVFRIRNNISLYIFSYIHIYIYINILSKFLRQGVFTIITIQYNTLGSDSFSLLFSLQLRATVITGFIQLYLCECWANVEILLFINLLMSCKGMRTSYLCLNT